MNSIVNASAIANEIQIPFPANGMDNMHASPIGKTKPSSREIIVDSLFF